MRLRLPAPTNKKIGSGFGAALKVAAPGGSGSGSATRVCFYRKFNMFRLRNGLHSHMRNVHIYPASKCEVCGKIYKRKDKLKRHMLVHTRKKEEEKEHHEEEKTKTYEKKNVFCQYCGKVYAK